jgi:regulator of protease activity HflC (stomatin/prohibitin superfamily)
VLFAARELAAGTQPYLASVLPNSVLVPAAALLVAAAGLLSAGLLVSARGQQASAELSEREAGAAARRSAYAHALPAGAEMPMMVQWSLPPAAAQVLASAVPAAFAVAALVLAWRGRLLPLPPAANDIALGLVMLAAAFPVLVSERLYAQANRALLPEARQVEPLLRVPLAALLATGVADTLTGLGIGYAAWLTVAIGCVVLAIAVELLLRAGATLFLPTPPLELARPAAESSLADLIRVGLPGPRAFSRAVARQFGIDLARSWALGFLRRALLPAAGAILLAGWALTGVTALRLDQRAIYERLGRPVAVLQSGLHVGLPWPLGIMRPVEFGVLHDIALAGATNAAGAAPIAAEAPPPAASDRLWDQPHPGEVGYLVASEARGQQGFELVDIDLRLIWRVGLSDQAALQAAYALTDPEQLVRAAAGNLLVGYFSSHTLLGVLGEDREAFTAEFRAALQASLDKLGTGLEAVGVIVEAIHPPQGAASAYHSVQAAEITATGRIATERGGAAETLQQAERAATDARNAAAATAATDIAKATADARLFAADDAAYRRDRASFLNERWLDRLGKALARVSLVIIDHRLTGAETPTLDLRQFGAPPEPQPQ